jgi:hypothetical protein
VRLELSVNLHNKKALPQETTYAGASNSIDGLIKTEQGRGTLENKFEV